MKFYIILVLVAFQFTFNVCYLKHSKPREDPDLDFVIVLGSTIVNASGSVGVQNVVLVLILVYILKTCLHLFVE
jgi:hypothetical protein